MFWVLKCLKYEIYSVAYKLIDTIASFEKINKDAMREEILILKESTY